MRQRREWVVEGPSSHYKIHNSEGLIDGQCRYNDMLLRHMLVQTSDRHDIAHKPPDTKNMHMQHMALKIHQTNPLPLALLAGSNHLEGGIGALLLTLGRGRGTARRALLGDLTPATAIALLGAKGTGRDGFNNAFVGKLAAADEFIGEAATVQSLRVSIDGIRDDFGFGRQEEQLLNKVIH